MYILCSKDNKGVIWYFKSKRLGYNFTVDITKAKRFKDEKSACNMARELWLQYKEHYYVQYIK
jgi:hypothetical protein